MYFQKLDQVAATLRVQTEESGVGYRFEDEFEVLVVR
jgi:hypothetical protein